MNRITVIDLCVPVFKNILIHLINRGKRTVIIVPATVRLVAVEEMQVTNVIIHCVSSLGDTIDDSYLRCSTIPVGLAGLTRKHIVETLDLVLQALYHGLDTLSIRIGIIPFIEHILIPGCLRQFKQFVCSKVRQLALSMPLCAPLVLAAVLGFVLCGALTGIREGSLVSAILVGFITRVTNRHIGEPTQRLLRDKAATAKD